MAMARERQKKLSETAQAYVLVREAAELSQWIKDKEQHAQIEDVGEDLEQVRRLNINLIIEYKIEMTKVFMCRLSALILWFMNCINCQVLVYAIACFGLSHQVKLN